MINKEEKILLDKITEKINNYNNKLIHTNFLNINEFNLILPIIKKSKLNYIIYDKEEILEKKSIAIIPSYIKNYDFNYIDCIKIKNKEIKQLKHKDYMGALYNLGINDEYIGDIHVEENYALVFVINKITNIIVNDLTKVGNNIVEIEIVDKDLIKIIKEYEEKIITANSLRIDLVLAKIYNLSRNNIKEIMNQNNIYINSKLIFKPIDIKEKDIISLKKYGKFQILSFKQTKKDTYLIKINLYK